MKKDDQQELSRRAFVGKVTKGAAGAALAMSVVAGRASALSHREDVSGDVGAGADTVTNTDGGPLEPETDRVVANTAEPSAPPPWKLIHPLQVGSEVTQGWRVTALTGVIGGASVLTLENAVGRSHRVHVCRNDGKPQGLIYTDKFDLVVMNGGRGDLPTEEGFGLAVGEVAHVIATNEQNFRNDPIVTALLTQSEREASFATTAWLR